MRFIISFIYAGFSHMALSFCHRFRRKMYPRGVPQRFCLAVPVVISYSQELISKAVANLHQGPWGWGGGQRQGNKTHMILTNLTQCHNKKGNTLHVNKHCFVAINSSAANFVCSWNMIASQTDYTEGGGPPGFRTYPVKRQRGTAWHY